MCLTNREHFPTHISLGCPWEWEDDMTNDMTIPVMVTSSSHPQHYQVLDIKSHHFYGLVALGFGRMTGPYPVAHCGSGYYPQLLDPKPPPTCVTKHYQVAMSLGCPWVWEDAAKCCTMDPAASTLPSSHEMIIYDIT